MLWQVPPACSGRLLVAQGDWDDEDECLPLVTCLSLSSRGTVGCDRFGTLLVSGQVCATAGRTHSP
eukprot:7847595-Alexandrium_andersonii.AAC.1